VFYVIKWLLGGVLLFLLWQIDPSAILGEVPGKNGNPVLPQQKQQNSPKSGFQHVKDWKWR
jgi:hypothetical protein